MAFGRRVNIITLGVSDLEHATAFYERLGWAKSSASSEGITFIKLNGIVLGLFGRAALAKDVGLPDTSGPASAFSGVTLAYNVASEAEVDEALLFAESCGAHIVKPPEKVFWGGYSGYFADPDGHLWEVAFNPFSSLDDDGNLTMPD